MKISKFALPMVAFLFAIIGAFALPKPAGVRIAPTGTTSPCNSQAIGCDGSGSTCRASNLGNVYDVFTDTSCQNLDKHSGSTIPF